MKNILLSILMIVCLTQYDCVAQLSFPKGTELNLETTSSSLYMETEILFHTGKYTITEYNWSKLFIDSLDPSWDFQACMNGDCKIGLPASGPFITDFGYNDTTGFIRFHVYTGDHSGRSTVKYYVTNNLDATDQALLTFNITYNNITGVKDPETQQNTFGLYPNPASAFVNIKGKIEPGTQIRIYNNISELVYETTVDVSNPETRISTSDLPEGLYFLTAGGSGQSFYATGY
jgi:hypothetical protein